MSRHDADGLLLLRLRGWEKSRQKQLDSYSIRAVPLVMSVMRVGLQPNFMFMSPSWFSLHPAPFLGERRKQRQLRYCAFFYEKC